MSKDPVIYLAAAANTLDWVAEHTERGLRKQGRVAQLKISAALAKLDRNNDKWMRERIGEIVEISLATQLDTD